MRSRLLALALVLAACSSSTPRIEHQTIEGGPGQAIEVELVSATNLQVLLPGPQIPQAIHLQFQISNNSNDAVTVEHIQVDQNGNSPFQTEPAQGNFNETIEPGHDHVFDVTVAAKQVSAPRLGQNNSLVIRVVVTLSNGDSYVYHFAIPVGDLG